MNDETNSRPSPAVSSSSVGADKPVTHKGYPRRPPPISEAQLAKDRDLGRRLYRIIYALPFVIVGIAVIFYLLSK